MGNLPKALELATCGDHPRDFGLALLGLWKFPGSLAPRPTSGGGGFGQEAVQPLVKLGCKSPVGQWVALSNHSKLKIPRFCCFRVYK